MTIVESFSDILYQYQCCMLQTHLPFAVVGSVDDVKVGNKMVKARLYPWGSVQGEYTELI